MFAIRILPLVVLMLLAAQPVSFAQRDPYETQRSRMVDGLVSAVNLKNKAVIEAMRKTPRHEFTPQAERRYAYYDMSLPIGESQTISAPSAVAYMTEMLDPKPDDNVLEIGTGSGYQAAVLANLVKSVYTIEIVAPLGRRAEKALQKLHYDNVHVKIGDGYQGWVEHAPFDKIIVTCSPEKVPAKLVEQLKEGGMMIIPVGERYQQVLYLMTKKNGKMESKSLESTLFVPMTGEAEAKREKKPDPANPSLRNGGFEEIAGTSSTLIGWHALRLAERSHEGEVPEGKNYLSFKNVTPGLSSQALQGMPVDGRKVKALQFSAQVRGKNIRRGQDAHQIAMAAITFYDERRALVSDVVIATWSGTFEWQTDKRAFKVPPAAREAILRIGLLGAVGEISFDDVQISPLK